jgi:hypothetical protein
MTYLFLFVYIEINVLLNFAALKQLMQAGFKGMLKSNPRLLGFD